jgi:hypothetical protein
LAKEIRESNCFCDCFFAMPLAYSISDKKKTLKRGCLTVYTVI